MADDLPVAVVIVDTEERIHAFVPQLEELNIEGLITLEAVQVVSFPGAQAAGR
jgi:PII-like signaling protein